MALSHLPRVLAVLAPSPYGKMKRRKGEGDIGVGGWGSLRDSSGIMRYKDCTTASEPSKSLTSFMLGPD